MPERSRCQHRAAADAVIERLDQFLGRCYGIIREDSGPAPPAPEGTPGPAAAPDRRLSGRLMRVNHAGEVCAQALYHGQAHTARTAARRQLLLEAAREEEDHLRWCCMRLNALGTGPSRLGPVWYLGSYAIGLCAGLAGDRFSLGFVEETERQVAEHLQRHLGRLPADDAASRVILERMRADEIRHGARARAAGGQALPGVVRGLMRRAARVMTTAAYYF